MKAIFFIGREHHLLKMKNVMDGLRSLENDVLCIHSTNSLNLDPSSEFLWRYGVDFKHLYDYLNPSLAEEINHTSYYSQRFSTDKDLVNCIAPFWISHSIREASESMVLFDEMLEQEKPDVVLVLHGANFWGKPLLYLAQEKGITTYTFQEGLLRHRDQETMNKQQFAAEYTDRLFTWSPSDMQAYVEAGVDESVIKPVGPTHLDPYIGIRSDQQKLYETKQQFVQYFQMALNPMRPIVTFAPPQVNKYQGDFKRAVIALSDYCSGNNIQLVIRLHPFDYNIIPHVKEWTRHYDVEFFTATDSVPLTVVSDLIISQHSTMSIEALFLGTMFAELDLDNVGILESNGLSIQIKEGDLGKIQDALEGNPDRDPTKIEEFWALNGRLVDSRATERACNIIMGDTNG